MTTEWCAFIVIMDLFTALAMLGLVAIYARQTQVMGNFGLVVFILALFGTMMIFGHQWVGAFVVTVLVEETPTFLDTITADTTMILAAGVFLSIFLMAVGWFLFGLASLQAKILPAGPVWLVMIGALLIFALDLVQLDFDKLVFYLGLAWVGRWLFGLAEAGNLAVACESPRW